MAASIAGLAGPAGASTITEPSSDPHIVAGDAAGSPAPFTVKAAGFPAGTNVYLEQCDGTSPTAPGWDPASNCDLGSAPAAAIADGSGTATFAATDPNHAFHPFKWAGPQELFNCLGPGDPSPANGLPDFRNCRIRVSTNNTAATSDQAFIRLVLPDGGAPPSLGSIGQAGDSTPGPDPVHVEDGGTAPGNMPRTGTSNRGLAMLGASLVGLGAGLARAARRTSRHRS